MNEVQTKVREEDAVRATLTEGPEECGTQEDVNFPPKKPIYDFFKRTLDIVFSLVWLIVLFLPLVILSVIILIDSPGASPIFVQERVGKGGRLFKFYKFRSMIPNADELIDTLSDKNEMDGPVFKLKDDPRITKVGRFIRRASIDELPQLWNVLRGDMSLVGPRPPLVREVEKYTERQKQRLAVTPGMTCYWQVQPKRNSIPFERWLELDLKYIRERSILLDIKLLFLTVGAVFGLEGE